MKILLVTETLYEGGAELFVLRLARGLIAKGENVQVLSLNRKCENKEMTAMFEDVPIQRITLPFISLIKFTDKILAKLKIDFVLKYFLLGRVIKRKYSRNYDIVHSNYIQADHCIASISTKKSFRHVVTIHGDYSAIYDSYKKGELRYWQNLDKKLKKLAANINQWVVLSEEQQLFFRDIMKVPVDKVIKIYNGYPAPASPVVTPEKADVFTIGMVARGAEKKGWQILINAFLKMPSATRLLLVGGSEYMEGLKTKYKENSRIIFTGFQSDPLQWMVQMDVFVLPTLYPFESLPNVITEALYCGLPIVATNVGEIERMITDDESGKKAGFVVDISDKGIAVEELYNQLFFLYNHPEELAILAEIAKRCSNKFDMSLCVNSYIKVYRKTEAGS
jgi:glycosyltransferase involved in cell wall biosynthesis